MKQSTLGRIAAITALVMLIPLAARAQSAPSAKSLSPYTRFFIPPASDGAQQQVLTLLKARQLRNAFLITAMELTPRTVWLTSGSPADVSASVVKTLRQAAWQHAVPVFALYNVPGRDCGGLSAGGAQTTADYEAWINAIASAIGNRKVVILLEPDSLALLPSECGYDPTVVDVPQLTADRFTQINYAVTTLGANPRTIVYIDAGNSHWHAVGDMAIRLVNGGLQSAQGFFSNVSNYRATENEVKYGTWISKCIAFANNPDDGGWRLGHYDWCASQYFSPNGPVNPDDFSTWIFTDQWYDANLGAAVPTTHFVLDTSRNGQGPFSAAPFAAAPFNQPASVIQTLNNANWCNPPGRGVGLRPSANTGVSLVDAYLWVKVPGESDGRCAAQSGTRAWDYTLYTQPGWPTDAAGQSQFDPLWGLVDPIAGAWFPEQALGLAQQANPPLLH